MALDFIGEILLQIVFDVVAYGTGRLVIPVLSLGTARGEPIAERRYFKSSKLWWREGGQLIIGSDATSFIGIAFWIAAAVAAYHLFK